MANDADLAVLAPATLRMAFPRKDGGVPAPASPWTVDLALASLALPEYGTATGRAGFVHASRSSAWAVSTAMGTPSNSAELAALALRAAKDHCLWLLAASATQYAGCAAWTPEGHAGIVEYRHGPDELSTVACLDPALPSWQGEEALASHSPTAGSQVPWDGTSIVGGSVAFTSTTVTSTSSTWGFVLSTLNFAITTVLNFAGAAWNFTANTLWSISGGATLRIEGPGKVQTCALLEVCGDMAWCGDDVPVDVFQIDDLELPEDGDGCGTVVVRLTGAGGDFRLSGLVARADGQVVSVVNATSYACLLLHLEGSAPANQFFLLDAHEMEVRPGGSVVLWYSGEEDRWNLLSEARDDSSRLAVEQAAHGFAVQDALCFDGEAEEWALADASQCRLCGIGVVCAVKDADAFTVQFSGKIARLSGLVAGQYYFVSAATPGLLVLDEPAWPDYSNPLLQARSETTGVVLPWRPSRIASGADLTVMTGELHGGEGDDTLEGEGTVADAGVSTSCCPGVLIPRTLHATISGGTMGSACLDGQTFALAWDAAALGTGAWASGEVTPCGTTADKQPFYMSCSGGVWQLTSGVAAGGGCFMISSFTAGSSVSCSPFSATFSGNSGNCLTGTYAVTITE